MKNRQQQATSTVQRGRGRPHRGLPALRGRAPGKPPLGLGAIEHAGADNSRT
jgi:hypothetical protein